MVLVSLIFYALCQNIQFGIPHLILYQAIYCELKNWFCFVKKYILFKKGSELATVWIDCTMHYSPKYVYIYNSSKNVSQLVEMQSNNENDFSKFARIHPSTN